MNEAATAEARQQDEPPKNNQSIQLAENEARNNGGTIQAFSSQNAFAAAQRMAKALSASSLVPEAYRGNLPNVLIAMELAGRIGVSVFAAMQNLDIIHGRPSWRSTFLIATVNSSGRFSPLRFRFEGTPGKDDWGCRCYAKDRENGEECVGPLITIGLAKAEGWYNKKGSKWQTIPELMLNYRAAAFWTRIYAPELSLGMHTADEMTDTHDIREDLPGRIAPGDPKDLETEIMGETPAKPSADPETGEVPEETERVPGEEG